MNTEPLTQKMIINGANGPIKVDDAIKEIKPLLDCIRPKKNFLWFLNGPDDLSNFLILLNQIRISLNHLDWLDFLEYMSAEGWTMHDIEAALKVFEGDLEKDFFLVGVASSKILCLTEFERKKLLSENWEKKLQEKKTICSPEEGD